ncbi:MAG: hypothetical protein HN936_11755, partial [Bacteroidetes bacterium]|nr:hypothetical protein [Bacteroidota bacterium]
MKQRLKKFLGHNLFITFILTIAVFWWIPLNSDLYRFTPLTERNWHTLSSRFAYNNLDTLPDLENILYYEWDDHTVTMVVNKDNTAIQQWKFTGQLQKKLMNVVVCDIFSDGLKEIASFYVKGNLLMFSVISPFENEEAIVEDYIIDSIPGQNPATFSINDSKFHDLNHDQIPELVFLVDGDYNQQPRNLYAFDFKSGELLKSPESATILEDIHFFDIDNDGNSEITGWVKSNCNYFDAPGATQPFPDTISWLMVFDHNLIYKFPPIGFPGRHSRVYPIIIDEEDHSELFVIHSTKFEGNQFFNIGHDGLKTSHEHKDLPSSVLNFCFNIHEDGGDNILWTDQSGTIGTYSLVEGTKTLQRKKAKESFYHIDDVIGDKGEEYWTFSSFNEWQFNLHNSKGQLLAREKFPKEHGSDFNPVIN